MKKILVVLLAIFLTCTVSYGKEPGQTKQKAKQIKTFGPYTVSEGEMLKGGIGYIIKADGASFVAMRNTKKPYTDKVKFKVQMKANVNKGRRNGFIQAKSDNGQTIQAGILIGAGKYQLNGSAVEKKEMAIAFDKNKIFTIELIIDAKKNEAIAVIDGKTLKTKITKSFKKINRIGYVGYGTQTEFTEISEI